MSRQANGAELARHGLIFAEAQFRPLHGLADRAYIIERGEICYQGTTEQLINAELRQRYLMI
jgi:ABC-type branched-subunit amino acid transport system ATPase component